jgi:hypothetical protein
MFMMKITDSIQNWLEAKTRRWWFFVGLIALLCLIPPVATKNFDFSKWGYIIRCTLGHSFFPKFRSAFPVFQIIAIAMIVLLLILRNRIRVFFAFYAGISFVLFTVVQNIAITPQYGLSIVTSNVVMFLFVAAVWFLEAIVGRNDFSSRHHALWKYLVIPPAILAFWLPVSWTTGQPDFDPRYFVTSGSSLAFCLMTPVFIAILIFFYPRVNMLTLRVTGAVGTIVGLFNVIPKLLLQSYSSWWDGVLHLPLLVLSILGIVLSMKRTEQEEHNKPDATANSRA